VSDRAIGYGMPGYTVNGNDPLEVYKVVKEAHERALAGEGPTLIEAITIRLTAHSSDDNHTLYRETEELEADKKNDPVITFANYLRSADLLTESIEEEITADINELVNEATDYAENAPYADVKSALDYVYEE